MNIKHVGFGSHGKAQGSEAVGQMHNRPTQSLKSFLNTTTFLNTLIWIKSITLDFVWFTRYYSNYSVFFTLLEKNIQWVVLFNVTDDSWLSCRFNQ